MDEKQNNNRHSIDNQYTCWNSPNIWFSSFADSFSNVIVHFLKYGTKLEIFSFIIQDFWSNNEIYFKGSG